MIEGILGKKIGMTQVFADDGSSVPVTVIEAPPCYVVGRKTSPKDGYNAVTLGVGAKKEKNTPKAMRAVFRKAGVPNLRALAEFRCAEGDEYKPGQAVKCSDIFAEGEVVDVVGRSKGKGFQGGVKRWHFAGGPDSHGSMMNRAPGSIGSSSDPSRVFKGLHMAGHLGDRNVTVQNLKIVKINPEENILLVQGAVPGSAGSLLRIKKSHKKGKK